MDDPPAYNILPTRSLQRFSPVKTRLDTSPANLLRPVTVTAWLCPILRGLRDRPGGQKFSNRFLPYGPARILFEVFICAKAIEFGDGIVGIEQTWTISRRTTRRSLRYWFCRALSQATRGGKFEVAMPRGPSPLTNWLNARIFRPKNGDQQIGC